MIADLLSISRIILAVLFILIARNKYAALIIIVIAGLTDIFDGMISRKYGKGKYGYIIDSIADKFFVLVVMLGLILYYGLDFLYALLMLSRDIMNIILSTLYLLKKKKHFPEVSIFGKLTTLVLVITFVCIILNFCSHIFIPVAIIVSILAAIYYLIFYFPKT